MLISDHVKTIEACRFCFMCRHVCTVGVVNGRESDTPRGKGLILFKTLKGHVDYSPELVDAVYRCCQCGMCETWCKADCHPPHAILAARADIVAQGKQPAAAQNIQEQLLATGNPFGLPAADRFAALGGLGRFQPQAEVVYYVGCETAYRQPQIARAMLSILAAAKVDFTLLQNECSTGKPLTLLGYRDEAKAMATRLAAEIRAARPKTLVTACPSAFDALKSDFAAMGVDLGGVEIVHAAQYLDRLMSQGSLPVREQPAMIATFLDSGYLGRTDRILDEPRRVLGRLPGLDYREMVWTRELAHSCGEPGGVFPVLYPELTQGLATRVLDEAAKTGARLLITTCPTTQGVLKAGGLGMSVRDLVEVVAEAVS